LEIRKKTAGGKITRHSKRWERESYLESPSRANCTSDEKGKTTSGERGEEGSSGHTPKTTLPKKQEAEERDSENETLRLGGSKSGREGQIIFFGGEKKKKTNEQANCKVALRLSIERSRGKSVLSGKKGNANRPKIKKEYYFRTSWGQ